MSLLASLYASPLSLAATVRLDAEPQDPAPIPGALPGDPCIDAGALEPDLGARFAPPALTLFNHAPPPHQLDYVTRPNGASTAVEGFRGARGTMPIGGAPIDPNLVRPKSLKEQALSPPPGPGVDGHGEVEIGRTATTRNLVDRARASGLADAEVAKLEGILNESSNFDADAALVDELLATENPARALRSFNDLDVYRRQNGDRITPDIVRTLTLGVGRARTDAPEGREGILGNASVVNAAEALVRMTDTDYAAVRDALDRTGPSGTPADTFGADAQTEQALLLKAVGARRDRFGDPAQPDDALSSACNEVAIFADTIRGRPAAMLIARTSALDLDGDAAAEALQQKWNDSCAQATLQLAQAEADPIYAWDLHYDVLHNTATTGAIANEQKAHLLQAGGNPTMRGTKGAGTSADMITAGMNGMISPATGRAYADQEVGDDTTSRTYAADQIERLVRTGTDVPIGVKWNGGGAHVLLVSDVRGTGDSREFLITDPWTGRTDWVSRASFIAGNTNFFAGNGRVYHYWW